MKNQLFRLALTLICFLGILSVGVAQIEVFSGGDVGVGLQPSENIDPSAQLEIRNSTATKKGLLMPRMLHSEMENIANAADGLMVFVTDDDPNAVPPYESGLYIFYSSANSGLGGWVNCCASTGGGSGGGTAATCSDGIQNQGETDIDCGGPCPACPTCTDGIQNQGETDIDCGGPCIACPTCSDGIQNQGETGVDCGGPCAPCGGGGTTCESFPNQDLVRDLPNSWNEYNAGGTGISGDGELCWKVNPHIGNTQGVIGLSDDPHANSNSGSIDYGFWFYIRGTNNMYRVYIRENGANKGLILNNSTDVSGMDFCIKRTGNTVEYLIDGSVVYTSTQTNANQLYFDNSHYDNQNSSIWGHRPSSSHYFDFELCH